jgi:hypothetical protein
MMLGCGRVQCLEKVAPSRPKHELQMSNPHRPEITNYKNQITNK